MYITNAQIANYRALETISVPLTKFSVLIGENDVGKTSFLYALDTFYACKKITDVSEFYRKDTDRIISIVLTFSELPDDPDLLKLKSDDGTITLKRVFKFNETPQNILIQNGTEKDPKGSVLKSWFSQDNFHFIPVRRDLSVQFSMNKTALLGKTLRARMKDAISAGSGGKSIEEIQGLLSSAIEIPRKELEVFLQEQMHNTDLRLGFNELTIDPVEGVDFDVHISDDRIENILIEKRGAGTQNNLILALFRFIAKINTGNYLIFSMEEPENSLHPKAQRQLLSVLQDISNNSQVIITTHSPVFIERTKFESNILINRTLDGSSVAKSFNLSMIEELRTDLGIRPSDALLKGGGNCALIVEGNTEEDGFPVFMEMLGMSEFKMGIAIIKAEGSDYVKIANICKLLQSYEIPCVVVLDRDAFKTAADLERHKKDAKSNIREIFVLKKGMIEDYYPLDIIAEVINTQLSPTTPVAASDFDGNLSGNDRLNNLKKVMFEHGSGTSVEYLKKMIGSHGTKIMKERTMEVDPELVTIFETVESIANSDMRKDPSVRAERKKDS